jgi:hypothetical protein
MARRTRSCRRFINIWWMSLVVWIHTRAAQDDEIRPYTVRPTGSLYRSRYLVLVYPRSLSSCFTLLVLAAYNCYQSCYPLFRGSCETHVQYTCTSRGGSCSYVWAPSWFPLIGGCLRVVQHVRTIVESCKVHAGNVFLYVVDDEKERVRCHRTGAVNILTMRGAHMSIANAHERCDTVQWH